MVKSNENDTGGGVNMMAEMGRNRRALRAIDANIVAARPCPSAMHKRSASTE
ncbi:hypothetical protein DM860_016879 [Cuscuta australis]|nr:hypothetical protein DM860_016879 [Cuscuta australis]